jgi:hypothetical protein
MTVSEYIPYYGMIKFAEYKTWIEGESMTVKEMFENYPDSELIDFHIHQLKLFELDGLEKVLKDNYFTTETVLPYLRELFDDYRSAGGAPLEWLNVTLESVTLNPECYKVELRATLEKELTEWIEIYKKIPFDALYHYTNRDKAETDKLKVPQIALIHVYEGKQITDENAKEIAAKYGYTAKTSGKGLYQDYLKYCKTSDRKAKPTAETKKTLINKIELFKSILNHLSDSAKQKANDEINILNTILEKEYQ